jgi:hypothetical protein
VRRYPQPVVFGRDLVGGIVERDQHGVPSASAPPRRVGPVGYAVAVRRRRQYGLTMPVFTHYGVQLWVPEVGGPVSTEDNGG